MHLLNFVKRALLILLLASGSMTMSQAQALNPDSLMHRMEEFGKYLLYRDHDTAYITSYADKLTIKLLGISKFNYFKIIDRINESSIRYRPDRKLNLGFGVSYRWFAADLAFNFGIGENSNFHNSRFVDFQGAIFSSKQYISATYQYYYGYQIADYDGVPKDDYADDPIRDDIRTVSFGLQYLFAFNYDKFSLKASFIQNEIQKRSAGSFLFGARFHIYNMDADSSAVPLDAQGYFNKRLHLTDVVASSIGINTGYMYTYVWNKNFYVTLSLIPGIALNVGDSKTDFKQPFNNHVSVGLSTTNAIGYNSERFFWGIQAIGDLYNVRIDKKQYLKQGHGKFKFYVGYRFG
jgi:hypothetical protein